MGKKKTYRTLGYAIQDTALNCKRKSVAQLAEELDKDDSIFYRMLNPNDDGARFPASLLIPLMLATNDFSALEHIASRAGHVIVNLKKLRVPKGGGVDIQNDLHETFADLGKELTAFFRDPRPGAKELALSAFDALLGEAIAGREKVKKWEQPELEFEG